MRSVGWKTYLMIGLSLVFAAFAFWRCYSGRFQPVTPNMLMNSGAATVKHSLKRRYLLCMFADERIMDSTILFCKIPHKTEFRDIIF